MEGSVGISGGHGPSLNSTPLEDFVGVPAIGMNKIDLIFERTPWRPSVIVAENSMVVKQHALSLSRLSMPVLLAWKTRHFVPRALRNRFSYFLSKFDPSFSLDASEGMGASVTVTYAALQLAYYAGAETVVLLGVDHNFQSEGRPLEYKKMTAPDTNHFDPNYFATGVIWGIPDLDQSEMCYRAAKVAYEADGRRILDATVGGKLTVFDRVSITDLMDMIEQGGIQS